MFDYIRGKLTHAAPSKCTVDLNGMGYRLLISLSTYGKLPSVGHEVLLYLTMVIREDVHTLFGFLTSGERDLFEKLNEVNGIGPKTSLTLLGHMEIPDLLLTISRADIAALSKVPGIGKKTAERLIVELRDKCQKELDLFSAGTVPTARGISADAISALINLGYNAVHAQKAVKNALGTESEQEADLSKLITRALASL
jgi:holliday junction DNA helicase RuvA